MFITNIMLLSACVHVTELEEHPGAACARPDVTQQRSQSDVPYDRAAGAHLKLFLRVTAAAVAAAAVWQKRLQRKSISWLFDCCEWVLTSSMSEKPTGSLCRRGKISQASSDA